MKRQMLSRILDTDARERRKCPPNSKRRQSSSTDGSRRVGIVSRIGLVKPQKARQITDLLIRMAQQGQIRGRITEDQLIGLLDQVDQASSGDAGKITVSSEYRHTPKPTHSILTSFCSSQSSLCDHGYSSHEKRPSRTTTIATLTCSLIPPTHRLDCTLTHEHHTHLCPVPDAE